MSQQIQHSPSNKYGLAHKQFSKLTRQGSESLSFQVHQPSMPSPYGKQKSLYYADIPMPKETPHWNNSAATLRHTTKSFRFSSSSRFPQPKSNYQDALRLEYPSLLKLRSTSQGVGKRVQIPEVFASGKFKSSQNCPFYEMDKESIQRSNSAMILGKGKTFGIGWRHYQPSRTSHRATVHSSYQQRSNPAPNHYQINPEGSNQSPKILMHQRLEMFTTKNGTYRRNQPDPQTYQIREKLVKRNQSSTSFGLGNKTDFTKNREKTPGPIYKEQSICDKFIHIKLKHKQI